MRHFLYEGFNEDRDGSAVLDGMLVDIAGSRRGYFNHRFARTTTFSRQTEQHFQPDDEFPFTYEVLTDPISGRTDGLLRRCRESETCPRILQSDNAYEVWQARASLVYTDPTGTSDVPAPPNVRYYLNPSVQHWRSATPTRGVCQQLSNPSSHFETLRALTVALQAWISEGKEPPPSRYPRLADGALVRPSELRFPAIPGVKYNGAHNHKAINDFSVQPPRHVPNTEYGVLVPTVDADGNEIPGIRLVGLEAPLGTYTGWSLRAAGFIEDHLCGTNGSYIPFVRTAAERGADPRPSLEERYETHRGYVDEVRTAANALVRQGYLLPEDRDRLIAEAERADIGLPR